MSIASDLDQHLSRAVELAEAGFYFSEGGCIGMALALYEVFSKAGYKPRFAQVVKANHVGVVIEGRFFDDQGFGYSTAFAPISGVELARLARVWGRDRDGVLADKAWAREIIDTALELAAEAAPAKGLEGPTFNGLLGGKS